MDEFVGNVTPDAGSGTDEEILNRRKMRYNCAQATLCGVNAAARLGFDERVLKHTVAGFGGGIGRLREVCGAVSGMTMTLSYKFACTDPNDRQRKAALYALIQRAAGEFKAETGSIVCRELLGLGGSSAPVPEQRTETYYKKRPCGELVRLSDDIKEKYIKNGGEI